MARLPDIIQGTCATSTGNKTFSKSGVTDTPVLAHFSVVKATSVDTVTADGDQSEGWTTSSYEFAHGWGMDNGDGGDCATSVAADACIHLVDGDGTLLVEASFVSFGAGQVTVNFTTVDAAYLVKVTLYYGANAIAGYQQIGGSTSNTYDINCGFIPDFVMTNFGHQHTGGAGGSTSSAYFSRGMSAANGSPTSPTQCAHAGKYDDTGTAQHQRLYGTNVNTQDVVGVVVRLTNGAQHLQASVDEISGDIDGAGMDGFKVGVAYVRNGSTFSDLYYVALQLESDNSQGVFLDDGWTSATSDGDQTKSGLSFEPGFFRRFLTVMEDDFDTANRTDTFGLVDVNSTDQYAVFSHREDGDSSYNSDSALLSGKSAYGYLSDALEIEADWSAFTSDGNTDNYPTGGAPATAVYLPTLYIEAPAASEITGTGSLSSGAASVSGTGTSSSTGTGALAAGASSVSGTGTSESTGTGALASGASAVSGTGTSASTGTGALAAGDAAVSGAGVAVVTGTGALAAQDATITGAGVSASTGTGALTAQDAAISGTGTSASTGAGALTSGGASISGTGTSASTGAGTLAAQDATITGAGTSASTGTGALVAGDATVVGSGAQISTGTGALVAGDASVVGSGVSLSTGTGALSADAATVSGAGVSASTGTGALAAQDAAISGTGVSASTGTGALQAGDASITGTSGTVSTGTGALSAQDATLSGTGTSASTGTGALAADSASIAGTGAALVTGTGALAAGAASVTGSGVSASTGTGAIQAGAASVVGAGVSASTGTGALQAGLATIAGSGVAVVTGTGSLVASDSSVTGAGFTAIVTGTGALVAAAAALAGVGGVSGIPSSTIDRDTVAGLDRYYSTAGDRDTAAAADRYASSRANRDNTPPATGR